MHVKRLTLIAIAAIAAGYAFVSSAGSVDAPRKLAAAASACSSEAQAVVMRDGVQRVCAHDLARFDVSARLKPLPLALAGLDFQPVDLADTPLAGFTSLGGASEAVNTTHSRLYRSFRMPDGRTVTLFEHDLSADGSRSWRDPKDEPERVNNLPARLDVLQADGGKAVSVLGWQEGRRDYQLWIDAAVLGDARQQLLALAAALPKSSAARPDDPVALEANGVPGDGK